MCFELSDQKHSEDVMDAALRCSVVNLFLFNLISCLYRKSCWIKKKKKVLIQQIRDACSYELILIDRGILPTSFRTWLWSTEQRYKQ